jgi:integrin alpha 8
LGYSSVSGDFTNDGQQGVAVGMPRGANLLGKIVIFSWNLTNFKNITGEQIGAYFGYSITTIDVDGDKLDDLIIGAPMYTELNNEGKYETGRVYIVYQSKDKVSKINELLFLIHFIHINSLFDSIHQRETFEEVETRDGVTSKGRFGLSVASLGDVNLDGYGDFAVGAPYDGPNGRGVVYIYHGSSNGPLEKPSQIIKSEDISGPEPPMVTFGFSLAGGIDLDRNLYPDMVIGAYETSSAVVLK